MVDDLLASLGLDGGGDDEPPAAEGVVSQAEEFSGPAGPQCFELDRWGHRRGADLVKGAAAPLGARGLTEAAAADLHAAVFDPRPNLLPRCSDGLRHRFLSELLETPEYLALHESTALNAAASDAAAVRLGEQFLELKDRIGQPVKGKPPTERQKDARVRRCVRQALRDAQEDVDVLDEMGSACGWSDATNGRMDPNRVARVYRRVRNNAQLARIMRNAGRFIRVARSKQRVKARHGTSELAGIELGDEVQNLLPDELAGLVIPGLKGDTLKRLAEKECLQYAFRDTEPQGKGPVVVVLDESGSMHGPRVETAKGLALALGWVARVQKRWFALVAFSHGVWGRSLVLPPGRYDEGPLLDWLSTFMGGGTSLDVPLSTVPFTLWPQFVAQGMRRGKTDMIVVTDGDVYADPVQVEAFNGWRKKEQCRVTSIIIEDRARDLANVSDEVYHVGTLDPSGEAVGRVLSV